VWQNKDLGVPPIKGVIPPHAPENSLDHHNGSHPSNTSVFSRLDPVMAPAAKAYPSTQATVALPNDQTASVFSMINPKNPSPSDEAQLQAIAEQRFAVEQRFAQQIELERIQQERAYLIQQKRAQEEEMLRLEREQMLHTGSQAQQDPLWLIQQAMVEQRGMREGALRGEQLHGISEVGSAVHNRHPIPTSHVGQSPGLGHAAPNQQYNLLQDLLFQQQQQQHSQQQRQILEQQLLNQQLLEATKQDAVIADAHQRIQQAEMLEIKHRRKLAKIQAMVRTHLLV
jgi:hypothetical protein